MGPIPYSERSVLPRDQSNSSESVDSDSIQTTSDTTESFSVPTTPSPVDPDALTGINTNTFEIEEEEVDIIPSNMTFYPSPADSMPFDHTFPVFLRQLTNERNLANVQSLKVRVISRLVSLHRMSLFTMNLRELDLEGSILGSLRDIGCNLKYLQILKVGNCQLDSLDGTFGLTSLKYLYAPRNQIIDVSPCSNLPHIQHIDVSHNRIRDISYAGFLSVCRKLKSIVFTGNPTTQMPDYRNNVKNLIPQLKSLDNVFFGIEDSESDARGDESGLGQSEPGEVYCQEEEGDFYDNTFENNEPSSLKYNGEEKCFSMKDNAKKYDSDAGDILTNDSTSFQDRDFSFLNLRREKDDIKQLTIQSQNRNVTVNIEETEDLVGNNIIHSCYQSGDFNKGIILPPLNTTEKEFKKAAEKGAKSRTEIQEKSASLSSVPDFERPSTSDCNTLSTRATSRNSRLERPYTASNSLSAGNCSNNNQADTVKKRPYTAGSEPSSHETDEAGRNMSQRDLTSGLPICGNLAVALRNRRKLMEREEQETFKRKDF